MAVKVKHVIIVYKNGACVGYLKSMSSKDGSFKVTQDAGNAKGYYSIDTIQGDIDFLSSFNFEKGYAFAYN